MNSSTDRTDVAIVGAGLSGLVAAHSLIEQGLTVRLFDKGRRPGGRMSSRRTDETGFDHGAQYFTVRDPDFAAWVSRWEKEGTAAPWSGRIGVFDEEGELRPKPESGSNPRFVGVPSMSAIPRSLAVGLDVRSSTRVDSLRRSGRGWTLFAEGETLGTFDSILVTLPPPQAADLLAGSCSFEDELRGVVMEPCWATLLHAESPVDVQMDGIFVNSGPLSWVARNNSKDGRPEAECWVLHASPEWSRQHLDTPADDVAQDLIGAFREVCSPAKVSASSSTAHLWRFALARDPLSLGFLFDSERRVMACGDWAHGSRVEGAFLSGRAAAAKLVEAAR